MEWTKSDKIHTAFPQSDKLGYHIYNLCGIQYPVYGGLVYHCGFEGMNITFTSDIKEALTDAKYIVNSGGAARKAGMTREDLLKGNAAIAEEFGKNPFILCITGQRIMQMLRLWQRWKCCPFRYGTRADDLSRSTTLAGKEIQYRNKGTRIDR